MMISSDDSKLRIFDGVDVVKKFKGTHNLQLSLSHEIMSLLIVILLRTTIDRV